MPLWYARIAVRPWFGASRPDRSAPASAEHWGSPLRRGAPERGGRPPPVRGPAGAGRARGGAVRAVCQERRGRRQASIVASARRRRASTISSEKPGKLRHGGSHEAARSGCEAVRGRRLRHDYGSLTAGFRPVPEPDHLFGRRAEMPAAVRVLERVGDRLERVAPAGLAVLSSDDERISRSRRVLDGQQVGLRLRRAGGSGARRRQLGRGSRSARRQGRESGRHDAPGTARAARLHRHDRGLQRLSRRRRDISGRPLGGGARRRSRRLESDDRQALRRCRESAPRLLPLGSPVLDARHDGHGAQHRPQRRGRGRSRAAHRRRALRLRQLSPAGADVRLGGDGDRRRAVRGGADRGPQAGRGGERLRPRCRRLAAGHRASSRRSSSARRGGPSRRTRASRSGSPPRRSSAAGTAAAPSTTGTPPGSPTTWARRSTSAPWSSATSATTRRPASR